MRNFIYENKTKIIFGKGYEDKVGKFVKEYGNKVLLHYGMTSIKKSGLYDKVLLSLKSEGLEIFELGGVRPNPVLSLVNKGIEIVRNNEIEIILAVGGGSVIDSAKAIAMGAKYEGDVWDLFDKQKITTTLPVGVILTIPAAGSESSTSTVITNDLKDNLKWGTGSNILRPVFAIMNPELTYTMPSEQIAYGASDILAHLMERYFTNDTSQDLSDRLLESTMKNVIKYTPLAIKYPNDYEIRSQIMWAGTLAHNDLFGCGRIGDWASHNIEHELSALYDIAHGAGLAVIFPAWMRHVYTHDLKRFARFAHEVFGVENDINLEKMAKKGISELVVFYKKIGLATTLKELSIDKKNIELMSQRCFYDGVATFGNFVKLKKEDVVSIYKDAL